MRLPACMLCSLTTILTCLFLRGCECMCIWGHVFDSIRQSEIECLWHVYVWQSVCHLWTAVCPSPISSAEAVIPVCLPAGGSQQSSISHCWAQTSVSVSSFSVHPAVSAAAAAAALTISAGWSSLTIPVLKAACPKLLAPLFQLLLSWPSSLSLPTHLPFVPSASLDAQLLGRGTYPLLGSQCCGGEVESEAGGWVSVWLSLSRSRLWAHAGRASLTGLHAVQLVLSSGCWALLAGSLQSRLCTHCHHRRRHPHGDVWCAGVALRQQPLPGACGGLLAGVQQCWWFRRSTGAAIWKSGTTGQSGQCSQWRGWGVEWLHWATWRRFRDGCWLAQHCHASVSWGHHRWDQS